MRLALVRRVWTPLSRPRYFAGVPECRRRCLGCCLPRSEAAGSVSFRRSRPWLSSDGGLRILRSRLPPHPSRMSASAASSIILDSIDRSLRGEKSDENAKSDPCQTKLLTPSIVSARVEAGQASRRNSSRGPRFTQRAPLEPVAGGARRRRANSYARGADAGAMGAQQRWVTLTRHKAQHS